jgi:DNA-binding transcriptional MerR regulator
MPPNLPTGPVAIADMADLFGVTHRTLHFYEEKKLLKAERLGNMRIYRPEQMRRMALINLCREIGMPIAQIQDVLAHLADAGSQEQADRIFRQAIIDRRNELTADESLIRRQMQQIVEILSVIPIQNDAHSGSDQQPHPPFLDDFERECLRLMAEGYMPVRIGLATGRSVDEVLTIEAAIIRKFGSSNRFQAVAKAVLLGLVGD